MKGKTFDDILYKIRDESENTAELGRKFEKITLDFFKTDLHYSRRFDKVVLWKNWEKRDGVDTGIDLIAYERDGSICAIQCKCYADDGSIDTKSVAKFLAKAASLKIQKTILVYTGEHITNNARKIMADSHSQILTSENFRQSKINWNDFPYLVRKDPKKLRPHQKDAVKNVLEGFQNNDRGKMIMACGTGKTLAALHIAEKLVGEGGTVLYVVPSISLILQSMREWSENANLWHFYLSVCSDKSTGEDASITELESPVSTDPKTLKPYLAKRPKNAMTVIFSTYHSLEVVKDTGQKFDLILCDEAHRTTGVEDKSFFTMIHQNLNKNGEKLISGKKRLYMTATPRVYSEAIIARAGDRIYSMDDEKKYGPEFHNLSFSDAVKDDILSDFRVKIAIVPADKVNAKFQRDIGGKEKSMPLDERTLLAAVWHGIQHPDDKKHPELLQRVIAFANRIDRSQMFAGEITDKNNASRSFSGIVEQYEKMNNTSKKVEVRHIDGKTKALERREGMRWLGESQNDPDTCRILSNARCLSEGVDVPALDGVIFLNPRKSRVDVVQSVGRVMRKSDNKKYGYVILPVAIPAGMKYHEALNDNKTFKVVWQVLNALRSHDESLGGEINKLILDKRTENDSPTPRISVSILDGDFAEPEIRTEFFEKVKSKLVEKVGDIDYYDKYGEKLGSATHTIEARLRALVKHDENVTLEVEKFHSDLKILINESITEDGAIQTISQHMVLSRVFDELFAGEFTSRNPISLAFETVISKIGLREELHDLDEFYEEIRRNVSQIDSRDARQNFIKKIYGNFFESADKKGSEKHGVVYTPVEIVDFIINSVQHVLKTEFGTEFSDRSVKVLEPFAGTGTFLARLLESGYLDSNLYEKYKHDLYANELILLAYYIATVNIETTYSSLRKGKYVPFDGISYTDTLKSDPRYREGEEHRQEQETMDGTFKIPHQKIRYQRGSHLHVIMGNPPYSSGQSNYNDQNQNIAYPVLDRRVDDTYLARLKKINPNTGAKNSLYDSYVLSIRWATDRIGESGIVAFVTNGSFLKSDTAAGIRASLYKEFTDVWCFDLRGNQRTKGDTSKREGGKIFGSGSRTPVAITILVRNLKKKASAIHYKNIGDYLTQKEKLEKIAEVKSIDGINDWEEISPDKHHDWIGKRNNEFEKYVVMGSKSAKAENDTNAIFKMYCGGLKTNRDVWIYNSSIKALSANMTRHIDYCNQQNLKKPKIDPKQAKWTGELSIRLMRGGTQKFDKNKIRTSLYRPFFKQHMYFDDIFINSVNQIASFFPNKNSKNLAICIPDKGKSGMFSSLIADITPDLHLIEQSQCFPLHVSNTSHLSGGGGVTHTSTTSSSSYRTNMKDNPQSLSQILPPTSKSSITDSASHSSTTGRVVFGENILDSTLQEYQTYYKDEKITKKDIFYYIYGILHHEGYKKKFANNLSREMPRIPMAPDFRKFSEAGQALAYLHLNYETCPLYGIEPIEKFGKLVKMSFPRKQIDKKSVQDKTKIKINGIIAFEGVPEIKYRVNGRTPIEWAIDRYKVTTDQDSGITNDPTSDKTEKKTIEMIQRLIYVGVESDKIISKLSKLPFEPENWEPAKTGLDAY